MSAGVILVDRQGRVLMQHRDDDPAIMFPGHWGLIGGASLGEETPDQAARREVEEETGQTPGHIEPFRAYYQEEQKPGARKKPQPGRADFEVYIFHAPCETPVEEMVCGEGVELRSFAPDEIAALDVAYNHREVLTDFFASGAYALYLRGVPFGAPGEESDIVADYVAALDAGEPWFDALMRAIALWQQPDEVFDGRRYCYLIGAEAFDWLLLAERLIAEAPERIPDDEAERLLFDGLPPDNDGRPIDDARLHELIGDTKHRAHLNYVYGVTVEEALQYAAELAVSKERVNVSIRDHRDSDEPSDPVHERIYGRPRAELLGEFRDESQLARGGKISLTDYREFMYWLFKYRVQNSEPARVASDTRKALAQLSAMDDAVRRSGRRKKVDDRVEEIFAEQRT